MILLNVNKFCKTTNKALPQNKLARGLAIVLKFVKKSRQQLEFCLFGRKQTTREINKRFPSFWRSCFYFEFSRRLLLVHCAISGSSGGVWTPITPPLDPPLLILDTTRTSWKRVCVICQTAKSKISFWRIWPEEYESQKTILASCILYTNVFCGP